MATTRLVRSCLLLAGIVAALAAADPAKGADTTILAEDFHDPAAAAKLWRGPGVADDGGWHVTLADAGSAKCSTALPADRIAGRKVRLSARIRSDGVSMRPNPWNGIKVMILTVTEDGEKGYLQLTTVDGTRPWTAAEKVLAIPANVTKADLVIGLESVSGSVWFDDVRVALLAE
jgi:hypothetical protein